MDKNWLLASVMLAALSLSGCDNNPGTHANNAGNAKSGSQASGETSPAVTAEKQPAKPAASASNTAAPASPATPSTASPGGTSGRTKTAQNATAQPTAGTAATQSKSGENAGSPATSAASLPGAAPGATTAGSGNSAAETRLRNSQPAPPNLTDAPVPGAARPGISGVQTAANIAPRKSNVGPLNGATGKNEAPVLGAAFSGISGAANASALGPENANRRAAETSEMNGAVGYDEQPVFGAAFSGISGATNVADLMPRAANRSSQESAQATTEANRGSQSLAQENAAVGYDEQPVFGAAFSGISGATNVADLMPRAANRSSQESAQATTEANRGSQSLPQENAAVGYDDQPVFGAAFSGISGATNVADLMPRSATNRLHQAVQTNSVGNEDRPVLGAASSGISGAASSLGRRAANNSPDRIGAAGNSSEDESQPVQDAAYTGVSGAPIARLVSESRQANGAFATGQNEPACGSSGASANNGSAVDLNYCRLYLEPAMGAAYRGASASGVEENNTSSS